jgi:DNA-nicking Smr family endonuclease|tara:strand:+ start:814 stop:1227 length:414 start_codon:yes stop_codon:yes gene_type:complete
VKKRKKLTASDKEAWETYTKNPKDLFDKENFEKEHQKQSRYKFDLHGYTLLEANEKVNKIINLCFQKKYNEILLITGKGIHSNVDKNVFVSKDLSKLRYSIPEYISSNPELSEKITTIVTAPVNDGGDGALILKLKY